MDAKNGDPLVMKCQIPKTEPVKLRSVRWSKKDFHYADLLPPLEKSPYYAVGQNGDLYFSYVTSVDTGSYVCVVGNTILGRTEERTIKLKVGLSQGKDDEESDESYLKFKSVVFNKLYLLRLI